MIVYTVWKIWPGQNLEGQTDELQYILQLFFFWGGGYNEGTTLSWALALHCEYKNATYNRCIVIDTIMVRHFNITALHCVADNLYT